MKKILIILCAGLILAGCGSRSTIEIKSEGKEVPFIEKGSWATVQKALYSGANVADQNHALRWITIRNYDLDPNSNPNSDVLTASEQVKIFLSLHDDAGTGVETPIKTASYKGAKTTGPMTFELINVYVFRDGKEERLYMYPSGQTDPATCEVKITSVDGDKVTGEINVTGKQDGKELVVKGPFTAQVYKR